MKTVSTDATRVEPVWRQLFRLRHVAPAIFYTCITLAAAEFVVICLAPLVVPDHIYLSLYLSADQKENFDAFLDDASPILQFDEVVGWSNRPNSQSGKWRVDQDGARIGVNHTDGASKPTRVLFLGSSLINGGTDLEFEETISGFIEDSETEAINVGTMMYALDQSYLAYKHRFYDLGAQVVVVGLSAYPTRGLQNRYIPFRSRDESEMPLFKPRFELESGQLKVIEVPPEPAQRRLLDNSVLLESIARSDDYYREFSAFKRFGLLPVSGGALYLATRARNFVRLLGSGERATDLLETLAAEMVREAEQHGASVIFLMLPDRRAIATSGWRTLLPDQYGRLVEGLERANIPLLDARKPLRESGYSVGEIYGPDGSHYTAAANQVIAGALKEALDNRSR